MTYSRRNAQRIPLTLNPEKENWTEGEVHNLLKNIVAFGHCDFEKILSNIPKKNKTQYKTFMRKLVAIAKSVKGTPPESIINLNNWISTVESFVTPTSNGPLELAIILMLLSLDGVLENHPLPTEADGVDYGACYRVLYQATLGHPIQPVDKKTVDVLIECFHDVSSQVDMNPTIVDELKKELNKKPPPDSLPSLYTKSIVINRDTADVTPLLSLLDAVMNKDKDAKSRKIKTYSRKSKLNDNDGKYVQETKNVLPQQVSVMVEALPSSSDSAPCSLQMSLNLPTRIETVPLKEAEKEVLEDTTYNPLKLPVEWLKNSSLKINKKAFE